MNKIDTINTIYDAYGKGDVPTILSFLDVNVEWEKWNDNFAQKVGVPYMRFIKGRENIPAFFGEVSKLGVKSFEVVSVMEGKNTVAVNFLIDTEFFTEDEIHLWTFNSEGKISAFRHYLDTAKHIAANEKRQTSATA